MAAVGLRRFEWAGGEHDFCIEPVGCIFAIEDVCGVGVMHVMRRLETDSWKLADIRETIRQGLIGAGMKAERANDLVKLHVDLNPHGLAPSVLLAHRIIEARIVGVPEDDPLEKKTTETMTGQASTTTMAVSDVPPSTG